MMGDFVPEFMLRAITLACDGVEGNAGGPFGSVVVKDGYIIGEGVNRVTSTNDPTAHAEVVAIREACEALNNFQLDGCDVYASCEPCPMCLGAIYWARVDRLFIACDRKDAAAAGFDDGFIYEEICSGFNHRQIPIKQQMRDEGLKAFALWNAKADKIEY